MNNYPEWWNSTITIFNKFTDKTTQIVRWFKTVLNGCFWQNKSAYLKIDKTVVETNTTVCRIPENENFKEKEAWINIPNDNMNSFFTLATGDFIVNGEASDVIDEYTAGHRSTDVIKKYKDLGRCIVIKNISINVGGGRNNPHYHVTGE